MSSILSTSTSCYQAPFHSRFSNSLRFLRLRPTLTAVKKIFHKIKSVPLFRRYTSEYIPFEEWEALYMSQELTELAATTESDAMLSTTVFDYEFADIEKVKYTSGLTKSSDLNKNGKVIGCLRETGNDDLIETREDSALCDDDEYALGRDFSLTHEFESHSQARHNVIQLHSKKIPFPSLRKLVQRS